MSYLVHRQETRCHVTAKTLDNSVLDHISSSSTINVYVHRVVGVKHTNIGQLAFLYAGGFRTWARHSVIRALSCSAAKGPVSCSGGSSRMSAICLVRERTAFP